jgi:hypothetical protein
LEQSPPDSSAHCVLSELYKRTNRSDEAARAETECRNRIRNPNEGVAQ